MNAQEYQKIYQWVSQRPAALALFRVAYKGLGLIVVALYALLLGIKANQALWLVRFGMPVLAAAQGLFAAVFVPAVVFVLGTLLRAKLNYPRPYEQAGFVPLMQKDKKGHACPSRHVLSVSVITVTWMATAPAVGCVLAVLSILIAAVRVIAGVHSVRDVVAGLLFGGVFGGVLLLLLLL